MTGMNRPSMRKPATAGSGAGRGDGGGADEPHLPTGVKNYITPQGFQRLQNELHHLLRVERPQVVEVVSWAAGNGDRSENGDYIYGKKRLREIDRRIRFLTKRLEIAQVVDPARQINRDRVYFGATVTYENSRGDERTVTILGVDEANLDQGEVSWISPIARALHKAAEGDVVELRTPAGPESIEVVEIRYPVAAD
jgi:transcription elongation factor GreB